MRTNPRAHATMPAGVRAVEKKHGIEAYELTKNGLTVLYRFDPTAPVVGIMVTYRVGSRHEATGHTGATHLLEHLMFKGSKHFPKKNGTSVIDVLSEKGALVNASTWLDRTNYFEVVPEEHAEFALRLEADRMRHATITKRDLDEEMPAVRSEFAMYENRPQAVLETHLWATAYQAHPYHHSTIGWLSDIEQVPLERLKQFYDTYYWPNNAVVSIVGNIERTRALTLVKRYFGVHPKAPHAIPEPYTKEPEQTGPRVFEVRRAGTVNMVGIAWKIPHALHPDMPALIALANILGESKTSRLYRALVEKKHAAMIEARAQLFKDPSLFTIFATPSETTTVERLVGKVRTECDRIAQGGVTKSELACTLAHIETELVFARDGHYATLDVLNEAIAVGDWCYYFDLPEKIRAVTSAEITRVAQTYLSEATMTTGFYKSVPQPHAPTHT